MFMHDAKKSAGSALLALALAVAAAGGAAASDVNYDLSPEQRGRPRAERDAQAIASIAPSFRFAEPGVLTKPWPRPRSSI